MKNFIIIIATICVILSGCSNKNNISSTQKNNSSSIDIKGVEPSVSTDETVLTLNSLNKQYENLLNDLYPNMVYKTKIETQITKSKKCIAIYVDVRGNLESTGVYIYTDVNEDNSKLKEIMLVSFLGTNTIYFNNCLNTLLKTCDLKLNDTEINEITDKYTEYVANEADTLSGYTTDEYSIFMSKDKVDLLNAYTVTIKM